MRIGSTSKTTLRPMVETDIGQVAAVHAEVFTDFFMTKMGDNFVRLYYAQYLDHPHSYGVVAVNARKVIGFIVGGCAISNLERRFYRRHFLTLGSIIATRFTFDHAARASIIARTGIIMQALRSVCPVRCVEPSLTSATTTAASQSLPEGLTASIMSIAVLRPFQGMGIGLALERRFIELARADGVRWARANVIHSNDREKQRRLKAGWHLLRSTDTKATFVLDISAQRTHRSDNAGAADDAGEEAFQ